VARVDRAAAQRALLHRGGSPGNWGNLGLWPEAGHGGNTASAAKPDHAASTDYAAACRALALAVGQAAGLQAGHRVLSLACGAGDELLLWAAHFGASAVLGVEHDPAAAQLAQARVAGERGIQVLCRPALALDAAPAVPGPFDAVVCVDAAYHLAPRRQLLTAAWQRLRPGGRLAYCDLVLHRQAGAAPWLRAAARLCGVPAADLLPLPQQLQRLQALGFAEVQAQALDDAVLDGFVRFVRRQAAAQGYRPWQPGWRAVATTAALIPPCRAAGLGYALLSATRPGAAAAG
jgi:SAM-dependent methyltransferase